MTIFGAPARRITIIPASLPDGFASSAPKHHHSFIFLGSCSPCVQPATHLNLTNILIIVAYKPGGVLPNPLTTVIINGTMDIQIFRVFITYTSLAYLLQLYDPIRILHIYVKACICTDSRQNIFITFLSHRFLFLCTLSLFSLPLSKYY